MILLRSIFNRSSLHVEGSYLSRIVTEHLLNSNHVIFVDFNSISFVTSTFFQEFIFPLVLEFGSETINQRLNLLNLSEQINASYQEALSRSTEFLERASAKAENRSFGELSDITFELLIKARELSRQDPTSAHIIFGLGSEMIKSIANMDIDQIRRVSCAGIICFEPRFTPEFASKLAALSVDEIDTFLHVIGSINIEGVYESGYS